MIRNVLLVDDDTVILGRWRESLIDLGYRVVTATTIEEARRVFPDLEWDAIAVDGCIGGDEFNCVPLIREFKEKCKPSCVIVAASNNRDLLAYMRDAGCTDVAEGKRFVPAVIYSHLG